jgi:hypothetical protein
VDAKGTAIMQPSCLGLPLVMSAEFTVMTLRQSSNPPSGIVQTHWDQKNGRQVKSKVKSMLIILFDIKRIVHKEIILVGQTVNFVYFCDSLWRLRENVQKLYPELWRQQNWPLLHDNALFHTSFFTREFLTKNNMAVISHLPKLTVFATCYFSLFSLIEDKAERLPF